jgi:hypothetical protein
MDYRNFIDAEKDRVLAFIDREFKFENGSNWSSELTGTSAKREEFEKYINFQKAYVRYLKTQKNRR